MVKRRLFASIGSEADRLQFDSHINFWNIAPQQQPNASRTEKRTNNMRVNPFSTLQRGKIDPFLFGPSRCAKQVSPGGHGASVAFGQLIPPLFADL
jgi:hypothetical protein